MNIFDAYFDAVTDADAATAVAVISDAVDQGQPTQKIMRDVVAAGQRKVGQLWFDGDWSVADEHAATGVAEQALTMLAPPKAAHATARRLVLACAEGEWHTLPARLAGELGRTPDLDVTLLGGSIPAPDLRQHLRTRPPDALALSCTLPTNLIGAARSIEAAHAEGVPVIVGGAAWGDGQHRAVRLGADLRLEDASGLVAALDTVKARGTTTDVPVLPAEALLLDATPPELLSEVLKRQSADNVWMRNMTPFQHARTLEDLRWLARHAAAAVACDDPTIMRDLLTWLLKLLTPRGVPGAAVIDSCYYLADGVDSQAPAAARLLRQEAELAHEQSGTRRDLEPRINGTDA